MKTLTLQKMIRFMSCANVCLLLALAGGCVYVSDSSSSYSDSDLKAVVTRTLTGEIPDAAKLVEIENRFGAIRVVAAETGQAQWSWKLTVQAQTDALAQQWADAANCSADRDGDRLRVAVSLPGSSGPRRIQSDLEIRVPKSVAIRSRNEFGPTTISGVSGDVEATGQNGSIELRDVPGKVRARTSFASLKASRTGAASLKNQNGEIEVSHVGGPLEAETSFASLTAREIAGTVKARNQNGRIEVTDAEGAADLKTSFADLRVEKVLGDVTLANQNGGVTARDITGSVKANTSFANMDIESGGPKISCRNQNGSIHLRARSLELVSVEAETSFSSLEARLPAGLNPAVQARTSFADIESDFPVIMKPRGQDAFADVDAATPRVKLQNQNGRIRIVRERSVADR